LINLLNWIQSIIYRQEGPPDLDQLFVQFYRKIKSKVQSPKGLKGSVEISFIVGALLFFWIIGGFYIIKPNEQGVVLRLGQYHHTQGPGLHFRLLGIDRVDRVNVQEVYHFTLNGSMLTRDENIVTSSVSFWYRIENPKDFLYGVNQPVLTLKEAAESAIRQVVGGMDLDPVLTEGREAARQKIKDRLIAIIQPYHVGISIVDVNIQKVKPPEYVMSAFDDAIKARENANRYVIEANEYTSKVIPMAEGDAARLIADANGYKQAVILKAQAKLAQFDQLLSLYQKTPKMMLRRLYLEQMAVQLSPLKKVLVDPSLKGQIWLMPPKTND
jgi:modulator of FtsH protease HflK